MGRRQFLTVRKRRCNERNTLKSKKQDKNESFARARLFKHVHGTIGNAKELKNEGTKGTELKELKELRNECTGRQLGDSVRHSHEIIDEIGEKLTNVDTDNCRRQIDDYSNDEGSSVTVQ